MMCYPHMSMRFHAFRLCNCFSLPIRYVIEGMLKVSFLYGTYDMYDMYDMYGMYGMYGNHYINDKFSFC